MITMKLVVSLNSPSDTTTTTSDSPYQSAAGVNVTVLSFEFAETARSLTDEEADKANTSPVSTSVSSNFKMYCSFSSMLISRTGAMIGASFIGRKVATNDVVSIRKLSEIITMISA